MTENVELNAPLFFKRRLSTPLYLSPPRRVKASFRLYLRCGRLGFLCGQLERDTL